MIGFYCWDDNLMKRLLYYLYYISCVDDFDTKNTGLAVLIEN